MFGAVDGAVVEVPYIGSLGAWHAVVGAVPSLFEVGGGEDEEPLPVVDGELGLENAVADDGETVVGFE